MKRARPFTSDPRAARIRSKKQRIGDFVVAAQPGPNFTAFRRRSKAIRTIDIPQEVKFFDTAVSFSFDSTLEVPATGQWALIAQGDTQSTRDGRVAVIKSVQFRGGIQPTAGVATTPDNLYLWVIQDKQANGAAASAADVFSGADAESCMINLNNSKRFKILHKEVIAPQVTGLSGTTTILHWPVEFYFPCAIQMDWNGTTGAIGEITQNNIFIVAGAGGTSIDDAYQLTGNARLRFVG